MLLESSIWKGGKRPFSHLQNSIADEERGVLENMLTANGSVFKKKFKQLLEEANEPECKYIRKCCRRTEKFSLTFDSC